MPPPHQVRRLAATLALAVAATLATGPAAAPAAGDDAQGVRAVGVTPGDFTGYGFDQCLAPTQKAMNRWLRSSPFLAAGIYISGKSRACREQPNLTPTWVSTQLAKAIEQPPGPARRQLWTRPGSRHDVVSQQQFHDIAGPLRPQLWRNRGQLCGSRLAALQTPAPSQLDSSGVVRRLIGFRFRRFFWCCVHTSFMLDRS